MMEHYEFQPKGVCSKLIAFDLEDGKIYNLHFIAGCPGNLSAISRLLEGADAMRTARLLRGNKCANRPTSCADQLATALEQAMTVREEQRKAS